jgi:predicted DNA-binding transcriptional regulator AlpA
MMNKNEYPDRFITEKEVAHILSVSVPTVKRMPDLQRVQIGVRRVGYRLSDVMKKIESAAPKKNGG